MNAVLNYGSRTLESVINNTLPCFLTSAKMAINTVRGIGETALSILTRGKWEAINRNATKHTLGTGSILPYLFQGVICVINPDFNSKVVSYGFLTRKIVTPIYKKAMSASVDESTFNKHVISRGAFALGGLVAVITRTADLALGLIAAAFAIIPCIGRSKTVNDFAMNQLTSLALIADICASLRGIINPQQSFACK